MRSRAARMTIRKSSSAGASLKLQFAPKATELLRRREVRARLIPG